MTTRRLLPVLLALGLGAAGCGGSSAGVSADDGAAVQAVAAFYPLELALGRVGGDRVGVEGLTPPGAEPHDLELGARQTARVSDADLLVHLAGFQPAVDEAADVVGDRALDVTDGLDLRAGDPHVWLDPTLLADVGDAVADRLVAVDADGEAAYRAGAADFRADLEELDQEFRTGLQTCARRELVVSHTAFGYLAARYDLEQVGISGLSPEEEPSPGRIAEAARYAKANDVTTIFFEALVSPDVAETVAEEVGARTDVLDPVEGPPQDGDYFSAMRANLQALRTALDCS